MSSPDRKEQMREYGKRYRTEKREQLLLSRKKYYLANREAIIARQLKRRADNRLDYLKSVGYPEPTRPMPDVCECCGKLPVGGKSIALDHNHKTGGFRGWLCSRCNTGIGSLGDDLAGVTNAINYLRKYGNE